MYLNCFVLTLERRIMLFGITFSTAVKGTTLWAQNPHVTCTVGTILTKKHVCSVYYSWVCRCVLRVSAGSGDCFLKHTTSLPLPITSNAYSKS